MTTPSSVRAQLKLPLRWAVIGTAALVAGGAAGATGGYATGIPIVLIDEAFRVTPAAEALMSATVARTNFAS